ncbi:glycosyl hydrolase family 28-related protein [Kibdelosporangium philippinense]
MHSRRNVLRGAGLVAGGMLAGTGFSAATAAAEVKPPDQWRLVPHILGRIRPPTFPNRVFDITAYGAVGDGRTKNTNSINNAIEECSRTGGGRVLVPEGTFLTGGLRMRPTMIQFIDCQNLLFQDVFLRDPAMWTPHPVFCTNATVRNVHIYSTNSQGDGVDLDSTSYAHVINSRFNTNDDCVVLKSGRDADGRRIGIPTSTS